MHTEARTLSESFDYCSQITKNAAKNFYYAFLTLPFPMRRALYAVYAFCRLCDDIADDPGISTKQKLSGIQHVYKSLEEMRGGRPKGPIFHALQSTVASYGVRLEDLMEVVKGVQMDLTIDRYHSFEELHEYCYRVASAVGLICIEVFGCRNPKARQYAQDFGLAMQLTNILRDLREDMDNGRIYLPLEDMNKFGYTEENLRNLDVNENFVNLMQFQIARAREYFRRGKHLLPLLPLQSRACVAILGGVYSQILVQIEKRRYDVFTERIALSKKHKTLLTFRLTIQAMIPIPRLSTRW